jgi:phosphopantothenoylcysteine decarboxylase
MYTHPLTAKQLKIVIDELGYNVIGPQGSKGLACGDIGKSLYPSFRNPRAFCLPVITRLGVGAMTEWTDIVQIIKDAEASRPKDDVSAPPKPASPFYNDVT